MTGLEESLGNWVVSVSVSVPLSLSLNFFRCLFLSVCLSLSLSLSLSVSLLPSFSLYTLLWVSLLLSFSLSLSVCLSLSLSVSLPPPSLCENVSYDRFTLEDQAGFDARVSGHAIRWKCRHPWRRPALHWTGCNRWRGLYGDTLSYSPLLASLTVFLSIIFSFAR